MLKITVPATSANLGPGFDALGIALDLYNDFYFWQDKKESPPAGLDILPSGSLAHKAAALAASETGQKTPEWSVAINPRIPPSRGLGSSASLTIAGLAAANYYLSAGLSVERLLKLACRLEGHPDNAAPALLGGLVVSQAVPEGVKYLKMMPGRYLQAVVAVPDFKLPTAKSRDILPALVSHRDAVRNIGRTALFVSSMILGDYSNLSLAMEDFLHQPYRLAMVPGMKEVLAAALDAGALGSCLSGAGPSILAFANEGAGQIRQAMLEAWKNKGIKAEGYILNITAEGAKLREIS